VAGEKILPAKGGTDVEEKRGVTRKWGENRVNGEGKPEKKEGKKNYRTKFVVAGGEIGGRKMSEVVRKRGREHKNGETWSPRPEHKRAASGRKSKKKSGKESKRRKTGKKNTFNGKAETENNGGLVHTETNRR